MKRARVRWQGRDHDVVVEGRVLRTADGTAIPPAEVTWLPPRHGTIIALGLNYSDHASELTLKAPKEPLVFIKAPSSLTGHKSNCCRPDNVDFMHFEAELVAVIGRPARNVKRTDAMGYVGGYTICNDFAVRDYLENYYRPGLRVKSRDSLSPLGPWIVDRDEIDDPHALGIRTFVNGTLRQQGSTGDMIFDIPHLIEYLSGIMTLQPGDMISTGTPSGTCDVRPGDQVVVEIDGIGVLENRIVSEQQYLAELAA